MAPVLVWSHEFAIGAGIDDIYRIGLAPERWFSFYPGYVGLAGVTGDWPAVGSTIAVSYRLIAGRTMTLHQEVVDHEPGALLELEERAWGGLWLDHPRFDFASRDDGSTDITLTVRPDSANRWARPFIWLASQPFKRTTPRAMAAFAASIEQTTA